MNIGGWKDGECYVNDETEFYRNYHCGKDNIMHKNIYFDEECQELKSSIAFNACVEVPNQNQYV